MNDRDDILRDIRKAMEADSRLIHARTGIELALDETGALTIEGEVESVAEKRVALERAAAVKGLAGIVDRLRVRPAAPMRDKVIRQHILRALYQDNAFANIDLSEREDGEIASFRMARERAAGAITVESHEGVVILNGAVPSLEHKRLAGVLAWWTPGSRDVVNGLAVEPPEDDGPDHLEEAVRIALEKDPFVEAAQIKVGVRARVVRLTGATPTEAERHMAECDAWYVFGVDDVINEIKVVRV